MRYFFLFIVVFGMSTLHSQINYKGKLIDSVTNEPIAFANIYNTEAKQGTYSNSEGEFSFFVNNNIQHITISYLGYKTLEVPISSLEKEKINTILFTQEDYLLEEIIVTDKPLNTIIEGLIENSQKELERNVKLETYYREFVKINDQYSKFADGLVDYYLKPKRKDKVKAKVIVNESRAFELVKEENLETKGTISSSLNSLYNFKDATDDFFSFNTIETYLSKTKTSEEYDFNIKRKVSEDGREIEIIEVKPLPEIEKLLIEGYIVYDAKKKLILEYDLKVSEHHKKYSQLKNMILFKGKLNDFSLKVSFKNENDKYIPNYKKISFDFYLKFGKMVNDNLSGTSDVLINHYQDDNVIFPHKDLFYEEHSLYENGKNYTTEFWKTNKAMPLSQKEETILESIKN